MLVSFLLLLIINFLLILGFHFVSSATFNKYPTMIKATKFITKSMQSLASKPVYYRCDYEFAIVYLIPMFQDNYCYLLQDKITSQKCLVDPGEPNAVIEALDAINVQPDFILNTHKHEDHVGGNHALKAKFPSMKIIGPSYEPIHCVDTVVEDNSTFKMGSLDVKVLYTPCHTKGHIVYLVTSSTDLEHPLLFCGDTLFVGGCGRFFEGTADDMLANMNKFCELSDNTSIFPAHEYTESNYRFLSHVDHELCNARYLEIQETRKNELPTIPSTIELEKATNLFMRCTTDRLMNILQVSSHTEAMAKLRELKNNF